MKNKNNLPTYLGIAVAIGIFIGSFLDFNNDATLYFGGSSEDLKIKRLIDYIKYDYVDEVDTDELLENTINHIVGQLDPHSVYFSKEDLKQEEEQMQGNFVGIGVQFRIINDSIVVIQTISGGPSEKVGLKAGDRIITANNDTISGVGITNKEVLKKLKGEKGTVVAVKVHRGLSDEILKFNIVRDEVQIKSVTSAYMLTDSIGYIKVERFARTTYDEFKEALSNLFIQNKNLDKLVLDLRDNPGGYMDISNQIADEFLEEGKLIVFTKNNKGKIDNSFATATGDFEKGEVYILINENSASASEIVSGALQDNDKGTIIGRRSFGKGLVQKTMDLGDGSALRLTIARYYTPTGRSIQKPYELNQSEDYYEQFYERSNNGELVSVDSIKVNDSLKFTTPKGKIVYGGGGIIPDVFVPIDTTTYVSNKEYMDLNKFSFEYIDTHRGRFEYLELKDFKNNFDAQDIIVNEYLSDIVRSPKLYSQEKKKKLKQLLQLNFARELLTKNEYNQLLLMNDNMIEKVFELEKVK